MHESDAVVRLHHLPLFGVLVFSRIRHTRSRCPCWAGHPTTMQRCAWREPPNPGARAYEPCALRMLLNSMVADAARKLGVSHEVLPSKFVVAGATAIMCGPAR